MCVCVRVCVYMSVIQAYVCIRAFKYKHVRIQVCGSCINVQMLSLSL